MKARMDATAEALDAVVTAQMRKNGIPTEEIDRLVQEQLGDESPL